MKSSARRKVRYAVVGLGHLGQVAVLPAFARANNSELVALVSGDPKKLSKMGKQYRVDKDRLYSYGQYDECLSEGVDAVYIVLPNHLHRDFSVRAVEAGVHVLCEKPMAVDSEECRQMIAAASKNKCKLMIAYRLHFEMANLEAIKIARSGKLGDLRFFGSEFAQQVVAGNVRITQPVAKGGGPIFDMGIYCINAARYLFGDEPSEISAISASISDTRFRKAEEMTTVVMRFPKERVASFTASFGAADIGQYTLVGTKGSIAADPAYEYAEGLNLKIKIGDKSQTRKFPKRDQFAAEISYFSECILKNRQPETSGEEGMADVRIIEAIYESARTGRVVKLTRSIMKSRPSIRQEIHKPPHGKPSTVNVKSPSGEGA